MAALAGPGMSRIAPSNISSNRATLGNGRASGAAHGGRLSNTPPAHKAPPTTTRDASNKIPARRKRIRIVGGRTR
jgi:hypothetical protein